MGAITFFEQKALGLVIEKPGEGCENGFYRYTYALNNPLVYTDPDGEFIFTILAAVFCPPLLPIAIAADVGGIINTATNWKSIDNVWEGVAAFGVGAGTGALTAVNPALGSMVGGSLTSATNNLIGQTGDGTGFQNVNWGEVGASGAIGLATGAATFGIGSAINSTGITNKFLDATGINNTVARNLIGSTVNGSMMETTAGFVNGHINCIHLCGSQWILAAATSISVYKPKL